MWVTLKLSFTGKKMGAYKRNNSSKITQPLSVGAGIANLRPVRILILAAIGDRYVLGSKSRQSELVQKIETHLDIASSKGLTLKGKVFTNPLDELERQRL